MGKSCGMCEVGMRPLRRGCGHDGRIILSCVLTKQDAREWTGFISFMYGTVNMVMNLGYHEGRKFL
jgi:hypothetical protein